MRSSLANGAATTAAARNNATWVNVTSVMAYPLRGRTWGSRVDGDHGSPKATVNSGGAGREQTNGGNGRKTEARLDDRAVAGDARIEHVIRRARPPAVREDFDLDGPGVARRLHECPNLAQLDDAVAHHAAIVEEVAGRHEPVADVVGEQALAPGTRDLGCELGVPPR